MMKRWLLAFAALALAVPATAADTAEGVVRKVSRDTGRITIKHGEIGNLDMFPMTMVF